MDRWKKTEKEGKGGEGREERLRMYSGQEHRLRSQTAGVSALQFPFQQLPFSSFNFLCCVVQGTLCCPTVIVYLKNGGKTNLDYNRMEPCKVRQ